MELHLNTETTVWFSGYGHLTPAEITEKKLVDEHFRGMLEVDDFLQNFDFGTDKESPEPEAKFEKLKKLAQFRNKTYQKNKLSKSAETAQLARSSLLSIRYDSSPICNIDLVSLSNIDSVSPIPTSRHTINPETFEQVFFSNKHQQSYDRLNPLPKLLLAQYIIHKQQDRNLKPYPFTFLLPKKMHGVDITTLSKKIQRTLSAVLRNRASMWLTAEYFRSGGYQEKPGPISHINGEILINPDNLPEVKKAFVRLFRSAEKRHQREIRAAGGTINTNPVPANAIIQFRVPSRNSNTARYGKFYAVFNWCSYASKQEEERARHRRRVWFYHHLMKKPQPMLNKEKFFYIESDLNKLAERFYNKSIKNKSPLTYASN